MVVGLFCCLERADISPPKFHGWLERANCVTDLLSPAVVMKSSLLHPSYAVPAIIDRCIFLVSLVRGLHLLGQRLWEKPDSLHNFKFLNYCCRGSALQLFMSRLSGHALLALPFGLFLQYLRGAFQGFDARTSTSVPAARAGQSAVTPYETRKAGRGGPASRRIPPRRKIRKPLESLFFSDSITLNNFKWHVSRDFNRVEIQTLDSHDRLPDQLSRFTGKTWATCWGALGQAILLPTELFRRPQFFATSFCESLNRIYDMENVPITTHRKESQ